MEEKNEYITLPMLAKILGITRVAVFKKVKAGKIKAIRIGRNYAVSKKELTAIFSQELKEEDKTEIENAVKKVIKDYGEVLRLLGKE
ncbi:MAG: helix-turn-helix domain-containing protein [Candidatus Omnitrophota bacterium]